MSIPPFMLFSSLFNSV